MSFRINIVIFSLLLAVLLFGDRSFSVALHADYYVFRMADVLVVILTLITGGILVFNIAKAAGSRKR
jgi:amino acid permease